MKKTLLSLMLLSAILSVKAQTILLPNGDFENWTNVSYNELSPWFNSNEFTIPDYGIPNVLRIAGTSGQYGVRLETIVSGSDTEAAFISNSEDDIENGEGGVPFTLQATSFQGTYRYNIMSGDTAWIWIMFKKNGNIISDNLYPITGSQSTAIPFSLPVATMSTAPDSVIIVAVSSNLINANAVAGSWLELDALAFDDGLTLVVAPDGDFENWTAINYDDANNWQNNGFGEVTKTTDKYTGSFAAKLVSEDDGTGYIEEANIQLGLPQQIPGMPFIKKVDTLTGYYKYAATGQDKAVVTLMLFDANMTLIGMPVFYKLAPAANYTYFEIPISSGTSTPATLMVDIASSDHIAGPNIPEDGSTLYIDNLRLKNSPDAIGDINKTHFAVYPNPAQNVLHIKPGNGIKGKVEVSIYDVTGKIVYTNEHNLMLTNVVSISLEGFVPGIYQYNIKHGSQLATGKFVRE